MSKLSDCWDRSQLLLNQIQETSEAYRTARDLFQRLASDEVTVDGVGLLLVFQGSQPVPVPLPADGGLLRDLVESAANALALDVMRLWSELHAVTSEAISHCNEAAERANGSPTVENTVAAAPPPAGF